MPDYHFETSEFGVSDTAVHYLRSRFNYKTIPYTEVDSIKIERGKELNNWGIILALGIALLAFGGYYCYALYVFMFETAVHRTISPEQILLPLIPLLAGGYCLYSSTRNGTILLLTKRDGTRDKFSLREIQKNNQLAGFQSFLRQYLQNRLTVNG